MFLLVRGGEVYAPERLGRQDVLAVGGQVALVAPRIEVPREWQAEVRVLEAEGAAVVPAFVDQHVHMTGGGGGGGPATQNPPLALTELTGAGIGTVVGCLGYYSEARPLGTLLARVRGLEQEGLSAYLYAGGIAETRPTLTGTVGRDLELVPEVLGVKAAVSDFLGGLSRPEHVYQLAAEVARGARAAGKSPVVHLHVGRQPEGLAAVRGAIRELGAPGGVFTITHVNWSAGLLEQAAELAGLGCKLDVTACITPEEFDGSVAPEEALAWLLGRGVLPELVSLSSDANGSLPLFDAEGGVVGVTTHPPRLLLDAFRRLARRDGMSLERALPLLTNSPARTLGLQRRKGRIAAGFDADLLVLDGDLRVEAMALGGRVMVEHGEPRARGFFERGGAG